MLIHNLYRTVSDHGQSSLLKVSEAKIQPAVINGRLNSLIQQVAHLASESLTVYIRTSDYIGLICRFRMIVIAGISTKNILPNTSTVKLVINET
ncbi:hypothetical protein BH09BAC4_BH09BAC4_18420 [soil metagenome]